MNVPVRVHAMYPQLLPMLLPHLLRPELQQVHLYPDLLPLLLPHLLRPELQQVHLYPQLLPILLPHTPQGRSRLPCHTKARNGMTCLPFSKMSSLS